MRLTVAKQLVLTFSAVVLLMLLGTLIMRGYLGVVETSTEKVGSESIPLALTVADMRFHAVNVQQFFTDASATGEEKGIKEAEESAGYFRKSLEVAKQIQGKRGDKNAQAELADLEKSFTAMSDLGKRMAQAYVSKGREAGNALMDGFDKATDDLSKRLEKISIAHASEAITQVHNLDDKLRTGLNIQWGLLFVSALLCAGLGLIFTRLLHRQLGAEPAELEAAAHRIASGDYSTHSACILPGAGGVSGALCVMVGQLEEAMQAARSKEKEAQDKAAETTALLRQTEMREAEVKNLLESMQAASKKAQQAGERIFSAIRDLADNMGNVSRDVVVQKDRMASTRTAMDQMNEAILEIARNTGNAAQSAEQSKANATSGAKGVREAVAATEQVKDRIISLKETMAQLGTQADSIGQVIGVINDIADQTNLLALNAAIEAARAGDAGRGFAVVADEVRKLAEKTVTATKQVGESVQSIQARARENVEAVDTAAKDIMVSSQLAEESGQSMEAIVGIVQSTALEVASIATASEEQSATSEEIKRAVEEVNHATENTARSVDQSQRIVVEISGLAEELDMIIQGMASGKLDSAISSDKLIEWSPSISVGINTIDDQHKVLIDLINELHAAMRQRKSDSVMLDVVSRLKDYTVKHFGFEEELFAKHRYPETEGHMDLHRKFVQKIADFEAGIKSGTATVGMEVMRFLKDWLIKHIQGTDTRYAPFMIERGVK